MSLNTPHIDLTIALVGNPNCGKTTLFNALTGSKQRVGNWPGVTVERKSGQFEVKGKTIEVIDLPGIYSLIVAQQNAALDEKIACDFLLKEKTDLIINIVDASQLERHLYLTIQLIEMGLPFILALNMMDMADAKQIQIDIHALSQQLGCPVIALKAHKQDGILELKKAILNFKIANAAKLTHIEKLKTPIEQITKTFQHQTFNSKLTSQAMALRLLEDDVVIQQLMSEAVLAEVKHQQIKIKKDWHEDADLVIADGRYTYIQNIIQKTVSQKNNNKILTTWTSRIDAIVLNRILGIPIFLFVMYLLFFFSINIGGAFQDFFDLSSQTLFVDGFAYLLTQLHTPTWLTVLLANGIGKGINTTITFIPVIGAMFLFLSMLEDSGYMARAAFVVDRLMRAMGLPGKSFVPMIVGFGCNVPAVMAARTLENKRDRVLTIMMSPFMSCGARLAIYSVFTAAFFPHGGQNVVFALYLIGILMAILTGFILRKTLLKGDPAPLVMELPAYHKPHFKTIVLHASQRLKGFVFRAGKLIIPICILIGVLNSLNIDGTMNHGDGDTHSLLSLLGQWLTPLFTPMGIKASNWPATVGLVTGILAKEVVVGTLNTLYTQVGHFAYASQDAFNLMAGLKAAFFSITDNFSQLGKAFSNPVLAKAPIDELNKNVYGMMYQQFDGKIGAFAYLLFVLLYFPCISTTAAMLRELHRGWSYFSIIWMTGVAYSVAVIFYQAATFFHHPFSSSLWIAALISLFFLTIWFINWYAELESKNRAHDIAQGVMHELN